MLARQLRLLRPASLGVAAGFLVYAGCSSSSSSSVSVTHPTMIEVSPDDFLGDVPCAPNGPGLRRYVATLLDPNQGAGGAAGDDSSAGGAVGEPFQLPSSVPTTCRAAVGFSFVAPGRNYRVEIDGYDTDDVRPLALGSRQMVTGPQDAPLLVEPKWRAECGRAIAVDSTIVRADRCFSPFTAANQDASGSLSFDLASLLGDLGCGSGPDEVDELRVRLTLADGSELEQSAACSADARVTFDELGPRQLISAYVTASSAGATSAFAGATCTGRTLPDARVDASCGALSQVGTLRVDLKAALALLGLGCNQDLSALRLDVPGRDATTVITPPSCLQPFDAGFTAGAAELTVTALLGDAELGALTCHAEVEPGRLVVAECEPNPAN